MATVEEAPEEGQVIGSEPVPAPVTIETTPSTSSEGQEERTDLKDKQPNSPIEMISSSGVSEQSLTIGLVVIRPPAIEIATTQASPSSSNEEVDYSRSDVDWDNVRLAPDSSKFLRLAVQNLEVTYVKGNLWFFLLQFV